MGTYNYHATKKHQLTSTSNGWSFGYDNNGNMTSGRGSTITWTSYNYPASIVNGTNTASFSYTPDRQYWQQVSNYASGGTATTVYVGGLLEKVTTSAGTDFRHFIRAGGSTIIVSRQSTGTNSVHYVTSDHLGSSSAVTNSSGGILVNSSFDTFGKRRGANWSGSPSSGDWAAIASTTRRGYTDHTMLDNLGLIHMNGRVQDPVLGRFASADPFITEPGFTQNFNRYSYVYNNPLRFVDPSGFNCENGQTATTDANGDGVPDDGGRQDGSASAGGAAACMQEIIVRAFQCGPSCMQVVAQLIAQWNSYIDSLNLEAPAGLPTAQSVLQGGTSSAGDTLPQGDHDYRAWNKMCKRALTEDEQRDLINRFTVPNGYRLGQPRQDGSINMVAWKIPGGVVTTTFTSDGLVGTNVTTPFHVFRGTVHRSIVNTPDGAYMNTHGYGGFAIGNMVIPPSIETGGVAIDLGLALDGINDIAGPAIFNRVDKHAARYAKQHFPGC